MLRGSVGIFYDWLATSTYDQALRVDGFRQQELNIIDPSFPDTSTIGIVPPVNRYLLAGKTMPWYAMALSIMATQAGAVTFISTTGQSYVDGMRFVQFYFGLPIAMVILSATAVPRFNRWSLMSRSGNRRRPMICGTTARERLR